MVSLSRYFRQIRRAGLKEYMRQMMYIGDAKAGTLVGKDQYVLVLPSYPTPTRGNMHSRSRNNVLPGSRDFGMLTFWL